MVSTATSAIVLSDQQEAVIDWGLNGTGHANLLARAGCGKTFTIIELVKALAAHNCTNIFIGAYNKPIAQEIADKLASAGMDWKTVRSATMHSIGFSNWRKMAPKVEVDDRKVTTILKGNLTDDEKKWYLAFIVELVSLAKQQAFGVLQEGTDSDWLKLVLHHNLDDKLPENSPIDGGLKRTDHLKIAVRFAQKTYRRSLELCYDVIDFDDMILAPLALKARMWEFDWVIIDEAQDTNPARRALAKAILSPIAGRMLAVGDDRQAIYGFTGADSDSMNIIQKMNDATVLPLNITRRCPKAVVAVAQQWVPDIEAHEDAPAGIYRTLLDEPKKDSPADKESEYFINEKMLPTDAILCRNTAPLITKAFRYLRNGVACRVEGRDIGEGLKKLARRWKIKRLTALRDKLPGYLARETKKWKRMDRMTKVQQVEDQVETLYAMIDGTVSRGGSTIEDLETYVDKLFGDTKTTDAPILTLATIHRSKGREWQRVFWLGRHKYQPSRYAIKGWQRLQEENLMYVAATRAMNELVEVIV